MNNATSLTNSIIQITLTVNHPNLCHREYTTGGNVSAPGNTTQCPDSSGYYANDKVGTRGGGGGGGGG